MFNTVLVDAILAEILSDTVNFIGWNGTFADLHNFVDANEYIMDVWNANSNPESAIDACNEMIEQIEKRLASLRK